MHGQMDMQQISELFEDKDVPDLAVLPPRVTNSFAATKYI